MPVWQPEAMHVPNVHNEAHLRWHGSGASPLKAKLQGSFTAQPVDPALALQLLHAIPSQGSLKTQGSFNAQAPEPVQLTASALASHERLHELRSPSPPAMDRLHSARAFQAASARTSTVVPNFWDTVKIDSTVNTMPMPLDIKPLDLPSDMRTLSRCRSAEAGKLSPARLVPEEVPKVRVVTQAHGPSFTPVVSQYREILRREPIAEPTIAPAPQVIRQESTASRRNPGRHNYSVVRRRTGNSPAPVQRQPSPPPCRIPPGIPGKARAASPGPGTLTSWLATHDDVEELKAMLVKLVAKQGADAGKDVPDHESLAKKPCQAGSTEALQAQLDLLGKIGVEADPVELRKLLDSIGNLPVVHRPPEDALKGHRVRLSVMEGRSAEKARDEDSRAALSRELEEAKRMENEAKALLEEERQNSARKGKMIENLQGECQRKDSQIDSAAQEVEWEFRVKEGQLQRTREQLEERERQLDEKQREIAELRAQVAAAVDTRIAANADRPRGSPVENGEEARRRTQPGAEQQLRPQVLELRTANRHLEQQNDELRQRLIEAQTSIQHLQQQNDALLRGPSP